MIKEKYKMVFIGSGGVGKTTLHHRLKENSFLGDYPDHEGASVFETWLLVDEQHVAIEFVDYRHEGVENVFDLILQDFRQRVPDAVFLTYSITDEESFETLPNMYEKHRINHEEFISWSNIKLALIGNKSDLETSRRVATERGEELAKKLGIIFFEISAMTGHNIRQCIEALVRQIRKARSVKKPAINEENRRNKCSIS